MVQKKTIEERLKTDSERQQRFREKYGKAGKKAVIAILSPKALAKLKRVKAQTGDTNSQIIERAILQYAPKPIKRVKGR